MPFICVIDTVFDGLTASWRDDDGKPVIYATLGEAEADAGDLIEDDDDERDDDECHEPDIVVEVVVTEDKIYDPVDGRIYWEKNK